MSFHGGSFLKKGFDFFFFFLGGVRRYDDGAISFCFSLFIIVGETFFFFFLRGKTVIKNILQKKQ